MTVRTGTTDLERVRRARADAAPAPEGFNGVGKRVRRLVVKLWRESGTGKSLKQWADEALVGDAAAAWIASKRGR
jgi:hypothetical protein